MKCLIYSNRSIIYPIESKILLERVKPSPTWPTRMSSRLSPLRFGYLPKLPIWGQDSQPQEGRNFFPCVDGRWSDRFESSVQLRVSDSTGVVDLDEHFGSFRLDAFDNPPPAFSLLFHVEAAL